MTDEQALLIATKLLELEVPKAGPTWESVVDLCLWVKDASKRLPKPKKTRNEYMRDYMRRYRARKTYRGFKALQADPLRHENQKGWTW